MVFGRGKGKKSYSSKTLSRFGKLGGRPQKHSTPAERVRAFRLRKKQLVNPNDALRGWRSYEEVISKDNRASYRFRCDACGSEVISGSDTEGKQCSSCYGNYGKRYKGEGIYFKDIKTIKRAGTSAERSQRSREKIDNFVTEEEKDKEEE